MKISAVVLAAGIGKRLKSSVAKPLIKIKNVPLVIYSLKQFCKHPLVNEIILVVNQGNKVQLIAALKRFKITKVKKIVLGGKERQDSVKCGLSVVSNDAKIVLIHDSARPFIDKELITKVIESAKKHKAAIPAVPVKATIKSVRVSECQSVREIVVSKTLDRNKLWEIQTPQGFDKDLLIEAFNKFGNERITDEAMLIEKMKRKVAIVMGTYSNIKITTPEDLIIAKAIAKGKK